MSTKSKATQQGRVPNPKSERILNCTWQSSQGILFKSTEATTLTYGDSLHSSDAGLLPSEAFTQRDKLKSSPKKQTSLPKVNGELRSSISVQDIAFSNTPLSELSEQEGHSTSQIHGSPDLQAKTLQDAKDPSSLAEASQPHQEQSSYTPLSFHIPIEKLKTAKQAKLSSPLAYWSYQLYQGPAEKHDKVKVHYCKNKADTERVAQLFLNEKVLGFDIEWAINATFSDGIRNNVALVQLASENRIALFHIARYPKAKTTTDFVAPSFKKIMESAVITKVGVAIRGDCTRLCKYLEINCRGLFELSHLYKLVKYSTGDVKQINKRLVSLADQVNEHLGLPLWKGEVRSSDWSKDLDYQQIQYAASDSYAGFHLFHALEAKRKALDPSPPRPAHAELNQPIRLADGLAIASVNETPENMEGSSEDVDSNSDISIAELTINLEGVSIDDPSPARDPLTLRTGTPSSSSSSKSEKSISLPPSQELDLANKWMKQHTTPNGPQSPASGTKAKPAELRAYALWHGQNLDVPTIANLLRKPPLQNSTVASYIGKALQSESLPFRYERIADLERYSAVYGVMGVNWKKIKERFVVHPKKCSV